jgi:hypothetical protein
MALNVKSVPPATQIVKIQRRLKSPNDKKIGLTLQKTARINNSAKKCRTFLALS